MDIRIMQCRPGSWVIETGTGMRSYAETVGKAFAVVVNDNVAQVMLEMVVKRTGAFQVTASNNAWEAVTHTRCYSGVSLPDLLVSALSDIYSKR